jgi:hypothetical protein
MLCYLRTGVFVDVLLCVAHYLFSSNRNLQLWCLQSECNNTLKFFRLILRPVAAVLFLCTNFCACANMCLVLQIHIPANRKLRNVG